MAGTDADDLGFELLPADDEGATPEQALAAAAASALEAADAAVPDDSDPPEPFGYSWAFDFAAGRFVRQGSSPARVTGLDALAQRVMMALNSARYAHPIFSDDFGVEDPQHGLGLAGAEAREAADDWRVKVRDAVLVLDGVTDVQVKPAYDPVAGTIVLSELVVTTQEEVELSFPDISIDPGGLDG